eukprot:CAMPEP_0117059300 /NCGR_PEP_ID=MMETSP0472-20121206/41186_1 /TAXON_ID=693140 ORGANISM="Tiarina fusus, Strain LIS" /NCGR_SAMPLE_ID=MMETSP0472 /ASSEMBLY_ACC=CAM_ASM_000603 /LENGTH=779 /DNA_ID=CAMNT_0004776943 /DNA_START=40 /DNA_END=2379 /DNA_ORIENTATION=+
MYIEAAAMNVASIQADSYFASTLPDSIRKEIPNTGNTLKQTIQSMSNGDLKETIFQFLQSAPGLAQKFLGFISRNEPTKGLTSSKENWNSVDGFKGRNWSEEYCQLLSDQDFQSKQWQIKMYRLSDDFFHAASLYAQVIIGEIPLPVAMKSIQPVNIGGIAGGQKFIIDNILFKFAVDSEIGTENTKIYMYGGSEQRNDLAMKAASIEMRNMQTVLHARDNNLLVPLMCVIDYQGHRIIASSIIPIDKYTLCYGSADGGRSVHRSDGTLNDMMAKLGERLHLKSHRTGSRSGGRNLYMPGDIEVHLGMDGRYYMIDVARLMPPEAPTGIVGKNSGESRKIYYQTLRPELVLGYCEHLNSDAFSAWNDFEPDKISHEKSLAACSHYLRENLIPKFSEALENFKLEAITYLPDSKDSWMRLSGERIAAILEVADISSTVHYYGINVRHLGLIRKHTTSAPFRDFLLVQCITRAMKNIMRGDMRNIMTTSLGSPTDMPLRDLVLSTYRKIHPFNHIVRDEERRISIAEYWKLVFEKTCEQFEGCFDSQEEEEIKNSGFHSFVKKRVDYRAVLYLFFKFAQVKLTESAKKQLMMSTMRDDYCLLQEFRLVRSDVEKFTPRIRKPYVASLASSLLLAREANEKRLAKPNVYRLRSLAVEKMQAAQKSSPSCPMLNKELAFLFWDLSKVASDPHSSLLPLFWAIRHMELTLSVSPDDELIEEKFNELLVFTEKLCLENDMCVAELQKVRARKHTGIASCPRMRLAKATGNLAIVGVGGDDVHQCD